MKILTVGGARPNFMKIAPFIWTVRSHNDKAGSSQKVNNVLVHTGQHYDEVMSEAFFRDLNIPAPDFNLGIGSGTHAYQVGQTMIEFEKVLLKVCPDWVVVVGDVNATIACSVTARKYNCKVAHIEAGLRSNDWTMPEEINRVVTDRVSDLLLTPCRFSDANLLKEGIDSSKILRVGNIMIDTLEAMRHRAMALDSYKILERNAFADVLKIKGMALINRIISKKNYIVLTLHRPSNVDQKESLKKIADLLLQLAEKTPLVFTVHPRTEGKLKEFHLWEKLLKSSSIVMIKPVGYLDMLCLTINSKCILTDSGGLQEEACVLGIPCITMRENTERPITLVENGGTNQIVGTDPEKIRSAFAQIDQWPQSKSFRPELWDGHTAERILKILLQRSP